MRSRSSSLSSTGIHRSQCSSACGARALFLLTLVAIWMAGCAKHAGTVRTVSIGHTQTGIASWYGDPYHGRKAANGEVYDMNRLTAAHRTLPFGTWVKVTNLTNAKQVSVRITDRGPFVNGRIIDLSRAAANQIDMIGAGTARVRLTVVRAPIAFSNTFYGVQVSAFDNRMDAERLKSALETRRLPVELMQYERHWRVVVGHESNREDAALLSVSLRADYPDAMVVRIGP